MSFTIKLAENNSFAAGDVLFFTSSRSCIGCMQSLSPSTQKEHSSVTHTAVVLDKDALKNQSEAKISLFAQNALRQSTTCEENLANLQANCELLSHSLGANKGQEVICHKTCSLLQEYDIVVLSATNKELKGIISNVATQFGNSTELYPARPCSIMRTTIRPLIARKKLPVNEQRSKIAKAIVDYLSGNPRLELKNRKLVSKATLCSEFVHAILQTALYIQQLADPQYSNLVEQLEEISNPGSPANKRARKINTLLENKSFFAHCEKSLPSWAQQYSVSFTPARLLTELSKDT